MIALANMCSERPNCVPQCSQAECEYLCRHMLKCTCMDYNQGHLCKHVHKVSLIACITNIHSSIMYIHMWLKFTLRLTYCVRLKQQKTSAHWRILMSNKMVLKCCQMKPMVILFYTLQILI